MNWVCVICSTANGDSEPCCAVCGAERPMLTEVSATEAEKSKAVFSDLEGFKESVKGFFERISSVKKKKKTHDKPPELKEAESRKKPAEEKEPEKPLISSAFAAPWPEHKVEFDASVIEKKGFVRSERESLNGVNGYKFYKADDTSQFIRIEMALIQKMAYKV